MTLRKFRLRLRLRLRLRPRLRLRLKRCLKIWLILVRHGVMVLSVGPGLCGIAFLMRKNIL